MDGVTSLSAAINVISKETGVQVTSRQNPTVRCCFLAVITKKEPPVHVGGLLRFLVDSELVIEEVLRVLTITVIFVRVDRIQATVESAAAWIKIVCARDACVSS